MGHILPTPAINSGFAILSHTCSGGSHSRREEKYATSILSLFLDVGFFFIVYFRFVEGALVQDHSALWCMMNKASWNKY